MAKTCYTLALLLLVILKGPAQVPYTANDQVTPYPYGFHPSVNLGAYTSFSDETLSELAAGNATIGVKGAGVKSLRPGLFESFLEEFGYGVRLPAFQFYQGLGMGEHTVIVGFPSPAHKDQTQYCPGIQSEMFANMYTPIWDGGANGTPYNDDNYAAAYFYKMVSEYKDYVRFWEIWNEPGFDYTGGLGYAEPGSPGNWWDNNPDPCDYKLRAPIFHYVRLLHIAWEVIKTVDPDAYVVVSGTGYPSFLDAILRNTDNPVDGSVTAEYPLKGGAYFDVMGYHSYPHFDGSLRQWSDVLNDWVYSRHSDAAVEGILKTKSSYQDVLSNYGYNGSTFPEKQWIITEINLPRKQFGEYIGSATAQRNFMIKAMATCMANDIWQMQVYKLAEDTYYDNAIMEFDLMGLYKRLNYNNLYFQELNEEGIAHKTASDILFGKTYDAVRTAQMNLGANIGGGACKDMSGNFTYILWAKTTTDQSENAGANYSFPANMNVQNLLKCEWDASQTHDAVSVSSANIALTGTPIFLTERIFSMNDYDACAPFNLQLTAQVSGAAQWLWTIETPAGTEVTFSTQNPNTTLTIPGDYQITLAAKNAAGQTIAEQTQHLHVGKAVQPEFSFNISGPITHFENQTPNGNNTFSWQFGDGQTSTEAVPTHVYLLSGTYTVTLTATNGCGSLSTSHTFSVVSPGNSPLGFTANDTIPVFTGKFRPGTSWDFVPGWTDEQIADIAAGNPLTGAGGNSPLGVGGGGVGVKALRTYIGESFFLQNDYDVKLDLFQHYENVDLRDNTFLLAFPSVQSRDPNFYCPDNQSNLFKDLYLDIWDGGANGTPVNDANPFALYVWNTVNTYKDYVKFWEIYNSPDFDLTGDKGWLPPGQLGNWWENNPDPCDIELRAPIFYYIRSLRIAYEIIHSLDPDAYVTVSGLAFPSFLDAICRNTDNPLDGSVAAPYPLKGGAYFDAVGFKSYPHFDGSTIYFDVNLGTFAYERHSDAAVSGIARVQQSFREVLENYGYDGSLFPRKEWTISEANIPRKQFYDYLGSNEAQRNWIIKAWVESVRNGIRQLDFFRLAESQHIWEAGDPFEVMGFYQKMAGVAPYDQIVNDEGIALKTCSDVLFGTDYNQSKTAAMNLPNNIGGAAFSDAAGNFIYVLWAKTETDQSETASATYTFPGSFGITQLHRRAWNFSQNQQSTTISPNNIPLTGTPIFLTVAAQVLTPPTAFFEADANAICVDEYVQFTSQSIGGPTHWEWAFEGGVPAAHFGEVPPAILYQNPGMYKVSLLVKNAAGEHTATYTDYITVQAAPVAEFDVDISGSTVQFVNLSIPAPGALGTTYEWCYGDGFCNAAASPSYTYFQNGDYTVVLTTSNECGESVFEQTITIAAAPTAAFTFQHNADCLAPVIQFLDLSFSAPESWHWEFPGGTPASSDLRYPVVSYPSGGYYEVTLIAGSPLGADTLTKQVYIEGKTTTNIALNLCAGSYYGGVQVFSDTTITTVYPTWTLGCDSSVVAAITIVDLVETYYETTLCEGSFFNGIQVFSDTVIVENFPLPQGCDSVSTVALTVYPIEEVFLVESIELGEHVTVGNEVFTQTGMYEVLLQTWQGCDSLVHLDLTVVTGVLEGKDGLGEVRVFPNPFSDYVFVEMDLTGDETVSVEVFDGMGRVVRRLLAGEKLGLGVHRFGWWLGDLVSGFYWVRLRVGGERGVFRVVKV
ncbi:MAG: PKD domain-containing protein [Saprospiraceae bacterium]